MARRTDFRKASTYTGQNIKGPAVLSYKIDGVRILDREAGSVTRNNKVPPGLDIALTDGAKAKIKKYGDCEVFAGSFHKSSGPLSRHNPEPNSIDESMIYPLEQLDERLFICNAPEGFEKGCYMIPQFLEEAVELGYEGLVIRNATHWYRVKPHAYADVYITGWFEQLDKNKKPKGQLGGFDTKWGKVTAFSDELRKLFWDNPEQYVGKMATVRYKERYHTGKFRYAVKFENLRTDKDEETFDTEPPEKG